MTAGVECEADLGLAVNHVPVYNPVLQRFDELVFQLPPSLPIVSHTKLAHISKMEKTFQDPAASTQFQNDAERQQENAKRADQGQPQIPGVADRETVASKDPKGETAYASLTDFEPNSRESHTNTNYHSDTCSPLQSSTLEAVPVPRATNLSKIPSCKSVTK